MYNVQLNINLLDVSDVPETWMYIYEYFIYKNLKL